MKKEQKLLKALNYLLKQYVSEKFGKPKLFGLPKEYSKHLEVK